MPISQPSQITVPFGTSGLKNTIPATADPVNGKAGYDVGFPAINMTPKTAGGIPPFGQDFNGIFFDLSTAIQFMEAGGMFPFSSAFATAVGGYPKGAVVSRSTLDGLWLNLVANNATNPDTGGAGWSPVISGGVVGDMRLLAMTVSTASASAAITASEVVVVSALGGLRTTLPSFSKTINLATTGAGGMDTGTAPASGFVALYAIYNPVTGASSVIASNATAAAATPVYSGSSMPTGYTQSCLLSVVPTNASSLIAACAVRDRVVSIIPVFSYGSSTPIAATVVSIGTLPRNAIRASGYISLSSTTAGQISMSIGGGSVATAALGGIQITMNVPTGNVALTSAFCNILLVQPSSLVIATSNATGGTPTFSLVVSDYTI